MDDLISMFVDGLKLFVVQLIYVGIPLAVLFGLPYIGNSLHGVSFILGEAIAIIGYVAGIILCILSFLLLNLASARLAETDSIEEALNIKELWKIATEIGWLRLVGFCIGLLILMLVIFALVAVVLFIIVGLLTLTGIIIPIPSLSLGFLTVGFVLVYLVLTLLVSPYLSILQYRTMGLVYNLRF